MPNSERQRHRVGEELAHSAPRKAACYGTRRDCDETEVLYVLT